MKPGPAPDLMDDDRVPDREFGGNLASSQQGQLLDVEGLGGPGQDDLALPDLDLQVQNAPAGPKMNSFRQGVIESGTGQGRHE